MLKKVKFQEKLKIFFMAFLTKNDSILAQIWVVFLKKC
jgi:hypothetical protein